jgi:hypothetical protein
MLLAMKRHGFIKGYLMWCDRLIKENSDPFQSQAAYAALVTLSN